jgi:hypothetical protein
MSDDVIHGGYILLARKMFDSWLMDKPPLWLKLWIWMLGQANWKDRNQLKKGQFVTTFQEMREAMGYMVGYRKTLPTRAEIRKPYEAFTKNHMISHTKSIRGVVITIENYSKYQGFKSYEEPHEEPHEDTTKSQQGTHDTENNRKQESIKELLCASVDARQNDFARFWDSFGYKKGREPAWKSWKKITHYKPALVEVIIAAAEKESNRRPALVADGRTPKMAQGWITDKRWQDEETIAGNTYSTPKSVMDDWEPPHVAELRLLRKEREAANGK